MIKPNPFTPQSGWEPRVFGGRKEQLDRFVEVLEAARVRPNHLIVLGEWGIGKTSLLKQFKKVAQGKGYLSSFCSMSKFTTKGKVKDGIDLISQEILLGFPRTKAMEGFFEEIEGLGISIAGFGLQVSRKRSALQPQVQLTQYLLKIWKYLHTKLAVILLDDVQNLLAIPQVLDILRLVLSRDEVINKTGYLFVLSSTPEGWSAFVDKHDPIGRFFRKRELIGNLTQEESSLLIDETLKGTGVRFDEKIKADIYRYTQGHPYELQLLASHLYEAQIEGRVTPELWDGAFRNTLRELGKDYFESLLRRASEREMVVLEILAEERKALSIGDIRSIMIVKKRVRNFPIANIKNFLYRLESKGLIRRSGDGNFRVLDPMFAEFVTTFKS